MAKKQATKKLPKLPSCPSCGGEQDRELGDMEDRECHACRSVSGCLGELDFTVNERAAVHGEETECFVPGLRGRVLGAAEGLFGNHKTDAQLVGKIKRHLQSKLGIDDSHGLAKIKLQDVADQLVDDTPDKKANPGRPPSRAVAERRKKVHALTLKGEKPGEIAARLKIPVDTVRKDITRKS